MKRQWISSAYIYNSSPEVSVTEVAEVGGGLFEWPDGTRRELYTFERQHDTREAGEMRAAAIMEAHAATFAAKAAQLREAAASRVAASQVVSV